MNTTKVTTPALSSSDVNLNKLAKQFDSSEDPIGRFFKVNQKIFTYILVAGILSVLGFRFYYSARSGALQRSAEVFTDTRSAYQVLAKQGTDESIELASLEAAKRSFEGTVKTLQDQNYPYDQLAKNYQVLAEVKSGNLPLADVKVKLEQLEWRKSKNSPNALWKELLALNLAKTLLADETFKVFALSEIKSLAQESQYLKVLSLIAWRGYADSNQDVAEQDAVQVNIENFSKAYPEQSDLLK